MDLYLPVDFYRLRDDLPDWCDAPSAGRESEIKPVAAATAPDAGPDPLWQAI
jgi:hypothetical protein